MHHMPRPIGRHVSIALALGLVAAIPARLAPQTDLSSVCRIQTSERIVAVGDVHGAYDRFVAILRAAGLVDGRARWTGGRSVLVQTGDVLDRGPASRRVLDLLRQLERDASRAGGQVFALLGNHEVMRIVGHWNDVSAGEYAAFRGRDSEDIRGRLYALLSADTAKRAGAAGQTFDEDAFRRQFEKEIPLGYVEMRQAFGPEGEYGSWLRQHPAMVMINGIGFVHGGIDLETAALGCDAINAGVQQDVSIVDPTPEQILAMLSVKETGPLWYRGLVQGPAVPDVAAILKTLGARALVVGHTPVSGSPITPRFENRVFPIDTGMLGGTSYPAGVASALEIRGNTVTAIYETRREPLGSLPALP
jgi:predicted MPP superfamily phosphohydrolase